MAKGLSWIGKADNAADLAKALTKTDDIVDAANAFKANSKDIVGTYKDLKKVVKGLGIKDMEVHHLIEKRFTKTLGLNANDIPSIALGKDAHKKITQDFREIIGYRLDRKQWTTANAKPDVIWKTIEDVYKGTELEQYIPVLKSYILENSKYADQIADQVGW